MRAFGALVSVLMICVLGISLTISLAAFIFVGPLAANLGQGIVLGLYAGLVLATVGAFGTSYRGTICGPQDITATILSP